jgi:hypothetical protein
MTTEELYAINDLNACENDCEKPNEKYPDAFENRIF